MIQVNIIFVEKLGKKKKQNYMYRKNSGQLKQKYQNECIFFIPTRLSISLILKEIKLVVDIEPSHRVLAICISVLMI